MKPKESPLESQADLFRSRLSQILDHKHPLYQLADRIDWSVFDEKFAPLYVEDVGRPGLPTRLMVGLHYLKMMFDESDESVVERFLENPYWQYFCGYDYFQHELPLDPSSMSRWRRRVGVEGIEELLGETIETAQRVGLLRRRAMGRLNVDTTVQEKAVAFPTDSRLYHKARRALVREAKRLGIGLRQSYKRLSKRALAKQGRYSHARQMRRARREAKRLRIYLGRVIRDIERKCSEPDGKLGRLLEIAKRIHEQQKHDKGKVYSVHAPEVECIAKGKAHKRYEFGCKVAAVSTSVGNWIVGIDALHGNPYDGHTLEGSLEQAQRLTGWEARDVYVDKGYRGAGKRFEKIRVHSPGARKGLTRSERRWLKRRSAIEPVIGHLKSDCRMDRNYLKGRDGDRMNAMLAGAGLNMRKLLRAFLRLIFGRLWAAGFAHFLNLTPLRFPALHATAR